MLGKLISFDTFAISKMLVLVATKMNFGYLFSLLNIVLLSVVPSLNAQWNQELPDTLSSDSIIIHTNLASAAWYGDSIAVVKLLDAGQNPNGEFSSEIPLILAIEKGSLPVVKALLDRGADMEKKSWFDEYTPLMVAVRYNRGDIADELLLRGADPDATDRKESTALMYAAALGYPELVDMLLYYYADIDRKDQQGNDALHIAVYSGDLESSRILIAAGADVNTRDNYGFTPLLTACQFGDSSMVRMLIEEGADISATNKWGYDALCTALNNHQYALISYLVEKGAPVNQPVNLSARPLDLVPHDSAAYKVLKAYGAKPGRLPLFNALSLDYQLSLIPPDYLNGFGISFYDRKYKLFLQSNFMYRLFTAQVLYNQNISILQLREKRSIYTFGVGKDFYLYQRNPKVTLGIYTKVSQGFSWAQFKGTDLKPSSHYLFIPSIGFLYMGKNFGLRTGYSWMDFDIPEFPQHRIDLSFHWRIQLQPRKTYFKEL